jgi:cell division protease FtsH
LKVIDEEVQRIIDEQYKRAQQLLKDHRDALEVVTRRLLETETVDGATVKQALAQPEKIIGIESRDVSRFAG